MREQVEHSLQRIEGVRRARVIDPGRRGEDAPLFSLIERVGGEFDLGSPDHAWIEQRDRRTTWAWLDSGHIVQTTSEVHLPIGMIVHHLDRARDILNEVY